MKSFQVRSDDNDDPTPTFPREVFGPPGPELPTEVIAPAEPQSSRSLLGHVIVAVLCGIPLALFQYGRMENERKVVERQKDEELREEFRGMVKGVRAGETGEAFRRLMDIPKPKRD